MAAVKQKHVCMNFLLENRHTVLDDKILSQVFYQCDVHTLTKCVQTKGEATFSPQVIRCVGPIVFIRPKQPTYQLYISCKLASNGRTNMTVEVCLCSAQLLTDLRTHQVLCVICL